MKHIDTSNFSPEQLEFTTEYGYDMELFTHQPHITPKARQMLKDAKRKYGLNNKELAEVAGISERAIRTATTDPKDPTDIRLGNSTRHALQRLDRQRYAERLAMGEKLPHSETHIPLTEDEKPHKLPHNEVYIKLTPEELEGTANARLAQATPAVAVDPLDPNATTKFMGMNLSREMVNQMLSTNPPARLPQSIIDWAKYGGADND